MNHAYQPPDHTASGNQLSAFEAEQLNRPRWNGPENRFLASSQVAPLGKQEPLPTEHFLFEVSLKVPEYQLRQPSGGVWQMLNILPERLNGLALSELPALTAVSEFPQVVRIVRDMQGYLRGLSLGCILSARLTLVLALQVGEGHKWLRIIARPQADEFGMITAYRLTVHDIQDESRQHRVWGSIAHLDPFGQPTYYCCGQEPRVTDELTDRELRVLQLMIEGLTSKEIGDAMQLSKDTIDKLRKQMLVKTGTKNSVELVARHLL